MKTIIKICIIPVILILGLSWIKENKVVVAYLTNNKKTIWFKDIVIGDTMLVDLEFCIENYQYPPFLPKNIALTKPDINGLSKNEKQNLMIKYAFDENNKVRTYYYVGSSISGRLPFVYRFEYEEQNPEVISEISEPYYKIKYRIRYDNNKNIESIEKLDSLNVIIEKLVIR